MVHKEVKYKFKCEEDFLKKMIRGRILKIVTYYLSLIFVAGCVHSDPKVAASTDKALRMPAQEAEAKNCSTIRNPLNVIEDLNCKFSLWNCLFYAQKVGSSKKQTTKFFTARVFARDEVSAEISCLNVATAELNKGLDVEDVLKNSSIQPFPPAADGDAMLAYPLIRVGGEIYFVENIGVGKWQAPRQ